MIIVLTVVSFIMAGISGYYTIAVKPSVSGLAATLCIVFSCTFVGGVLNIMGVSL